MSNTRRKKPTKTITKSIAESLAELRKAEKEFDDILRRLNMKR
jgi:hypothetical protein